MCDPVTAALMAASGGLQANMQARQQNQMSRRNRAAAVSAQNQEADAQNISFEEETRAAVQDAYLTALEGRATEASFLNMAADSGIVGASVNEGLFSLQGANARNRNKFLQEQQSRITAQSLNMAGLKAKTTDRINSVPLKSVGLATMQGAITGGMQGATMSYGPSKGQKTNNE